MLKLGLVPAHPGRCLQTSVALPARLTARTAPEGRLPRGRKFSFDSLCPHL
jgi:hypothetical protein